MARSVVARTSRRPWERRFVLVVMAVDGACALLASLVAVVLRFGSSPSTAGDRVYFVFSLVTPLLWVAAISVTRAYETRYMMLGSQEFHRVTTAAVGVMATVGTLSWATKAEVARGYVVVALPVAAALTLAGRYEVRRHVRRRRARGGYLSNVLAVGHAGTVAGLVRELQRESQHGMRVVGACLPDVTSGAGRLDPSVPVVGSFADVEDAVVATGADAVAVLTCPELDGNALRRLSWDLARSGTDLFLAPALIDVAEPRLALRLASGLPLLHVNTPELTGGRRVVKACVDKVGSALGLLVLAPVLVAITLAVRLTSPGPAIYRQTRVGWHGRTFTMLKFRTMRSGAEAERDALGHLNLHSGGPLFKIPNDPRVTRVGRWLRSTSLDELPQLVNVLRGEMSLVGPRPPLPREVDEYGVEVRRRLLVKPGLTGLWQISGRSDLAWEDAVRLDLRYVENWSLGLDLQILWKTFAAVIRRDGAY